MSKMIEKWRRKRDPPNPPPPSTTHETFSIIIPSHVVPGSDFQVSAGGRLVRVHCPPNFTPGDPMRITIPVGHVNQENGISAGAGDGRSNPPSLPPKSYPVPPQPPAPAETGNANQQTGKTRKFQVVVPDGVIPGHPFSLLAAGMRVLVTCPRDARPGQKIQFDLPEGLVNRPEGPKSKLAVIKLSYGMKDGWTRCIRPTDMKFQWTRLDEKGDVDERTRFDAGRSAYVLKLDYVDDNDSLRRGRCSLVTAERGIVDSRVESRNGTDLVSYSDVVNAQMKSYKDKIQWFQETCARLSADWDKTNKYAKIAVRREYLLGDSIKRVMSFGRKDLRTKWWIEFIGEDGIDAGGLAREWYQLVTDAIFDPDNGLWQMSETNQMCMQINPASAVTCPDDHLCCFRFLGRVMGKAIFDRHLVTGHMVKHLYKHILGYPVMMNDLKDIDEEYYNSLKSLKDMGSDVQYMCIDFTQTEETLGVKKVVELIPDGANVDVTEENLPVYIEACLKYRMLDRYKSQLNELLLGFFDVIPEPLLTIFDFQELELLMCGLPHIDMDDWMKNTMYGAEFSKDGANHKVCIWFWEVVSEYDHEMKARLLQFVTGTSGVPAGGFSMLQGIGNPDGGTLRKFTILGMPLIMSKYPKSQ